jgi:glycosyltransferase involved in cell wall biosynthesis
MMNNLHISLTEFRNESRVLKEASSIASLGQFDKIFVAALYAEGLEEHECYGDGVEAKRFKLKTRSLSKGLFTQAIKYLEFVFKVELYYRKKEIGMINVHALALLPLGYFLKLIYGAKLIYDTHELETETNGLKGVRKTSAKWIERLLIGKADQVFVVSENIANWYAMAYNQPRPTVILNVPRLYTPLPSDQFREAFGIRSDQIIVLYQGGLSLGRGVDVLLSAFKQRTDDQVVIVFMGYGGLEAQIQQVANQTNNVFLHPAVPPNVVLDYTGAADIGISFVENTCLSYYYCMPNKLFEYAMAGLPVIVSDMKEMGEMVRKYQMGVVVKGGGAEAINTAIDGLSELDLVELKGNVQQAAKDNAWEVQEARMLGVYRAMNFGTE